MRSLRRHRAPLETTRAKDAAPAAETTRGRVGVCAASAESSLGREDAMQRVEEMTRPRIGQTVDHGLVLALPFDHARLTQRAELLGKSRGGASRSKRLEPFSRSLLASMIFSITQRAAGSTA